MRGRMPNPKSKAGCGCLNPDKSGTSVQAPSPVESHRYSLAGAALPAIVPDSDDTRWMFRHWDLRGSRGLAPRTVERLQTPPYNLALCRCCPYQPYHCLSSMLRVRRISVPVSKMPEIQNPPKCQNNSVPKRFGPKPRTTRRRASESKMPQFEQRQSRQRKGGSLEAAPRLLESSPSVIKHSPMRGRCAKRPIPHTAKQPTAETARSTMQASAQDAEDA